MKNWDLVNGYNEMDQMMKELDKIDNIIEKREDGDFRLPDNFSPDLNPEEEKTLSEKYEALSSELYGRGFDIILDKKAPLVARWLYAQHVALLTEGLKMPGTYKTMFNGCMAWCEDCFQRDWCSVREEIEKEEV